MRTQLNLSSHPDPDLSGLLGFWHEHRALKAMGQLIKVLRIKSSVLRDGISSAVFCEEVVPGDFIFLKAGDKKFNRGFPLISKVSNTPKKVVVGIFPHPSCRQIYRGRQCLEC